MRSLSRSCPLELIDSERRALLLRVCSKWVTQSAFDNDPDRNLVPIVAAIPREQIEALVRKLGGNPDAPLFGPAFRGNGV